MSAHIDRITKDLMTLENNWKEDMEVNMQQINSNINSVIKTELHASRRCSVLLINLDRITENSNPP